MATHPFPKRFLALGALIAFLPAVLLAISLGPPRQATQFGAVAPVTPDVPAPAHRSDQGPTTRRCTAHCSSNMHRPPSASVPKARASGADRGGSPGRSRTDAGARRGSSNQQQQHTGAVRVWPSPTDPWMSIRSARGAAPSSATGPRSRHRPAGPRPATTTRGQTKPVGVPGPGRRAQLEIAPRVVRMPQSPPLALTVTPLSELEGIQPAVAPPLDPEAAASPDAGQTASPDAEQPAEDSPGG